MLLRINNLIKGYSGVRPIIIHTLVNMLNAGVHPIIPEKGSLGASGDLAPLAHMVLVMFGLGEAIFKGERMSGIEAMNKAGIEIIALREKEGLALINGTQVMTAIGCLNCYDAKQLMKHLDIAAAMTVEALNGIVDAFDERLHLVRPHKGQLDTAANMRKLLTDSMLTTKQGELRVQDAYTIRCIPQIHGASKDAFYKRRRGLFRR
jgi:histidine ammonia-lyase